MASIRVSIEQACQKLRQAEDIFILAHKSPDGDTLGSSFALMHALRALGKQAQVLCSDPIPPRFGYLRGRAEDQSFAPGYLVACDVADTKLLGPGLEQYAGRVDLCIDHHISNREYAAYLLLDSGAAAACQLMLPVIQGLGVEVDSLMASCLYTGLATDTGCFRYSNTGPDTHRTAARLMDLGADSARINKWMFETKTQGQMRIESAAMSTLEYHFEGRCALIHLTRERIAQSGCREDEMEGISALPRQIEGVEAAVTLRQNKDCTGYKISLRTGEGVDAALACAKLGGGGHARAAGGYLPGDLDQVRRRVLEVLAGQLEPQGRQPAVLEGQPAAQDGQASPPARQQPQPGAWKAEWEG